LTTKVNVVTFEGPDSTNFKGSDSTKRRRPDSLVFRLVANQVLSITHFLRVINVRHGGGRWEFFLYLLQSCFWTGMSFPLRVLQYIFLLNYPRIISGLIQ